MGLVFAPISTAVLAGTPAHDRAKASGTNSTLREVAVALGIAVLTAVFTGAGGQLTPTAFTDAGRTAVLVGAAALAAATLFALLLPAGREPRASDAESNDAASHDAVVAIPAVAEAGATARTATRTNA